MEAWERERRLQAVENGRMVCRELERLIDARRIPGADPETLAAIRSLTLRFDKTELGISFLCSELLDRAAVLYSARKHRRLPGGSGQAWGQVYGRLKAIQGAIEAAHAHAVRSTTA